MSLLRCFEEQREELEELGRREAVHRQVAYAQVLTECDGLEIMATYSLMLDRIESLLITYPDGEQSCIFLTRISHN